MHTVCHFDIPSTDLKRSAAFYGKLFGWKMENLSEDYTMILLNKRDSGGIFKVDHIKPSQIALYFEVEDIPAILARAADLGGSIAEEKRSIGENGFVGAFKDPEGVRIDVWSRD